MAIQACKTIFRDVTKKIEEKVENKQYPDVCFCYCMIAVFLIYLCSDNGTVARSDESKSKLYGSGICTTNFP